MMSLFFILLLLFLPSVLSFTPPRNPNPNPNPLRSHSRYSRRSDNHNHNHNHNRHQTCRLFGLAEWRDLDTDFPSGGTTTSGNDTANRRRPLLGADGSTTSGGGGGGGGAGMPPKSLCVLPFHYTDVLLQGETKQLRLYEDRFIQLFQDAMDRHCGVVAMGLIADDAGMIIKTVPVCEIEAYNRMDDFGIFVTIRVVARAQLVDIVQQEPYIKAACVEINDAVLPPNLDFPNLVASNIENFMLVLSSMEHRLAQAKQELSENSAADEEEDEEDSEMQRRINIAKLEDRFYNDFDDDDDDDDDDNDDDDNDDDDTDSIDGVFDRRKRFRQSYEVAMATDTQGYCVSTAASSKDGTTSSDRSPQELTALSWASFCTELLPEEDATFKIQALDCDDLFERLKLASHMLRAKKADLKAKMKKAGLSVRDEDNESQSQ